MKKRNISLILLMLFLVMLCVFSAVKGKEILKEIGYTLELGPLTQGTPDPLNDDLSKMVSRYKNHQISVIDMSSITTFTWDRVHIFLQYASASDIDPIVGRSWHDLDSCSYGVGITASSDGYSLLVFTYKSVVVYCLVYLRSTEADFYVTEFDTKSGIPQQEALFTIDQRGKIRQVKK